jgi:hypothetical protein
MRIFSAYHFQVCKNEYEVRTRQGRGIKMMGYTYHKKGIIDQPSIWFNEGRYFLDIGKKKWRQKWEEVYKYEVLHWEGIKGVRINLDSLIKAIYPDLKKDASARAMISMKFMFLLREERRRLAKAARERRLAREKNREDTE